GACMPFIDDQGLQKGNNRLAFAPDGSLWVGHAAHGWGGDTGIQRIIFTGKPPADIYSMNLTAKGFDLTFTQPLDDSSALLPDNYMFQHYYYAYHKKYGSDRMDVKSVPVTNVGISDDHNKVSLTLSTLKRGYVYQLDLGDIRTKAGDSLDHHLVCYTVKNLRPVK